MDLDNLGSIPTWAYGFNHVIILGKITMYNCALANQAIQPFNVGKFVLEICWGSNM